MFRKPWPIVVLATLHILEPAFKVLFYSLLWDMPARSFLTYMQFQSTPLEIYLFFFAFPLAGLAILAVKNWSLPAFFSIQAITLASGFYFHVASPKTFPIALITAVTVVNILAVTYVLVPTVRLTYTDPSLRWWESKPRFIVDWAATLLQGKSKLKAHVCNISEGGVFLETSSKTKLTATDAVQVEFEFDGVAFSLAGRIRHYSAATRSPKYGIQFTELPPTMKRQIHSCVKSLRKQRAPQVGRHDDAWQSFKEWAFTLATTGKGLFPEVQTRPRTAKAQVSVGSEIKARKSHRKSA